MGSNAEGQLAQKIGTNAFHEEFCKITIPTQETITGVECGYLYTIVICGSKIYAAGDNQYGYVCENDDSKFLLNLYSRQLGKFALNRKKNDRIFIIFS